MSKKKKVIEEKEVKTEEPRNDFDFGTLKLSNEDRLRIEVSNLQLDNNKKDLVAEDRQHQLLQNQAMLSKIRIGDLKRRVTLSEDNRKALMVELGQKLGVDISKYGINPISGELTKL
jgi:hypothetical protein